MDTLRSSPTCPFGCEVGHSQDASSHISAHHGVLLHNAFLDRLLEHDAPYDLPSQRAWLAFNELPMFLGAKTSTPLQGNLSACDEDCTEERVVFIAPCGHVSESEQEATEHQQLVCLTCSASCEFILMQGSKRLIADDTAVPASLFWRDVRLPQAGAQTYQRLAQLLRGEGVEAPRSPSRAPQATPIGATPCPHLATALSLVRQGVEEVRRHAGGGHRGAAAGQARELRKAIQELQALVDALQQ